MLPSCKSKWGLKSNIIHLVEKGEKLSRKEEHKMGSACEEKRSTEKVMKKN